MENMENENKLENILSNSDKVSLEKAVGNVIVALLLDADGKDVNVDEKSQKLLDVVNSMFDKKLSEAAVKYVTPDTLKTVVGLMINELNKSNYQSLKSMLEDPCNVAYFKLAQKNEELKARNVTMGALSASVAGLKPRYLEKANVEFASLLENVLKSVKVNIKFSTGDDDAEKITDAIDDALADSYVEKYSALVEGKYTELEELEAHEDVNLSGENDENHVSRADKFLSKLDNSMKEFVHYNSSLFYEPEAFMVSVNPYYKLNKKINKLFAQFNISNLTLPRFVILVKGNSLTPEELKAAQSWLSDTSVETYDTMADLVLGRK